MKDNRELELMNQLRLQGKLELAEVTAQLEISESTARRLFARLEKEGKVIRVHGGIQFPGLRYTEYSFDQSAQTYIEEKNRIAAAACDLLQNGDVIFCDTGTTVLCFCMELLRRLEQTPIEMKVYTNSLANFEVLAPKLPVTLIGGEYRRHRKDFAGYLAETALEKVHFSKCFLGTDGCDMKHFFTTMEFDTARLDEIVMENSAETTILCASDKFSGCAQVGFAELEDVHRVITDAGISESARRKLEHAGIEVVIT